MPREKKWGTGRRKIPKVYNEVPPAVLEEWERMKAEKNEPEPIVKKVSLLPWEELEITTPQNFYVFGCDPTGQLLMGQTSTDPKFLKTMAIDKFQKFTIPTKALRALGFTTENAMQVFKLGDCLILKPIIFMKEPRIGFCDFCGKNLSKLPRHWKIRDMTIKGKTYHLCSNSHYKEFRKQWTHDLTHNPKGINKRVTTVPTNFR